VLSSKKGYSAINNILSLGGLDVTKCYIATKQQRYSYISCTALIHLLQSRDPLIVCLRNKDNFLAGLLSALQAGAVAALGLKDEEGELQLDVGSLQFKCQNDIMFLHRHAAYSMSGLYDQVAWRDDNIYDDPSGVLAERGIDIETAFLSDGEERFAWLSVHALFILMGCGPSVGDGGAESYQTVAWRDLLSAVALQEPRLRNHMKIDQFKKILLGKIITLYIEFLDKNLESSNIVMDTESGIESGTDNGLGSVGKTVEVNNMDPGSSDEIVNSPIHSDTDIEEPRGAGRNRFNSSSKEIQAIATASSSSDQEVSNQSTITPQPPSNIHSPFTSNSLSPSSSLVPSSLEYLPEATYSSGLPQFPSLTPARYTKLKSDILTAAGGVGGYIGDWEVCQADRVTKLSVRPGYGASRKGSFLQPDYAAILRYTVILSPGKCNLTINEQEINSKLVSTILDRGEKEGTLSFLFQLISLRPCFGSFSPELVETVSQSQDKSTKYLEELYIDSNFIGTSSSGRTYAGTVRSKLCDFLAADRVSDCCGNCKKLEKLTINRSILTQEEEEIVEKKNDKYTEVTDGVKVGQKSVWQLATTSKDGCSFLCPQVQSFNSSLPHAFDGSEQVTSIVNHRVEISNNLKVKVELSERPVSRTFPEFQKSRQLGPLLDWVAGLRLCVGYPNMQLVKQATFILQNIDRLKPELRKLFKFLAVDNKFTYQSEVNKLGDDCDGTTIGTIRAGSCLVTAESGADICHQCRLLQEPIEFLSI